jgi:hypothetical protein
VDQHLVQAKKYLAIAESRDSKREAYKRATQELVAYKSETRATIADIAISVGKSEPTIKKLFAWHRSGFKAESPFLADSEATNRAARSHTKAVLRDAPMEQVERIISELPMERIVAIGAAAGDPYMQARHKHDEERARRTPAQMKEQEAARAESHRQTAEMMSGFTIFGIVNYLGLATETLQGMVGEHTVTKRGLREVEKALREFVAEYRVAAAMAGLDAELETLQ